MKKEEYELLKKSEQIVIFPYVKFLDSVLAKTIEGIDAINSEYVEEINKVKIGLKALATAQYNTDEYISKLSSLFVDFGRSTLLYNQNIELYEKWFSEYNLKTFPSMESKEMKPVYDKLTRQMNDMYLGTTEPDEKLINFVQNTINNYIGYKSKAAECEKLLNEIDVVKNSNITETIGKAEIVLSELRYALDENTLGDPKIKNSLGNSMNNLETHFNELKDNRAKQSKALKYFVDRSQEDISQRNDIIKFMDQFQTQIVEIKERTEEVTLNKKK